MAVSALIVTLREDGADGALRAIVRDARFTAGQRTADLRVPVVLDTPDAAADQAAFDWLRSLPGVELVDVVVVYLDDREAVSTPEPS